MEIHCIQMEEERLYGKMNVKLPVHSGCINMWEYQFLVPVTGTSVPVSAHYGAIEINELYCVYSGVLIVSNIALKTHCRFHLCFVCCGLFLVIVGWEWSPKYALYFYICDFVKLTYTVFSQLFTFCFVFLGKKSMIFQHIFSYHNLFQDFIYICFRKIIVYTFSCFLLSL